MTDEVKRYDFELGWAGNFMSSTAVESDEGKWVRYEDHAALLATIEQETQWWPVDVSPEKEGLYIVWQRVPPQSHPLQVGKFQRRNWVTSWPVLFWRPMIEAPPLFAIRDTG